MTSTTARCYLRWTKERREIVIARVFVVRRAVRAVAAMQDISEVMTSCVSAAIQFIVAQGLENAGPTA